MSIFEIVMLLCFASAWPFSIYKSYTSKQNAGKSLLFMYVVEVGYIAGLLHKYFYNMDGVFYLYLFILQKFVNCKKNYIISIN